MKINDKYIDHEELTHVILKQNTPIYSNEEEILTYIDEYFKEHGYDRDEVFWVNKEYELESVMNDIADILNLPVTFHMIWEPDSEWYMIWKWAFSYGEWNKYFWTILDEDYAFDITWSRQLAKKFSEVQTEYINMAEKLSQFIEKTLA